MNTTAREMLDASQEIGGICEMAAWASDELAHLVQQTGKPVGELTIAELIALRREHAESVRRIYAPAQAA